MSKEEYRVTAQFTSYTLKATVTISQRVQADSHSHATDIAREIESINVFYDIDDWKMVKRVTQNQEQIDE